ncbi:MAG: hypothetical protein ACR2RA_04665 [Geminicoccaceae bacterium]
MSVARMTVRLLAVVAALLSVAACDDDEKPPKYDTTILISDHIDIVPNGDTVIKMKPERRFKKPRVEVHTPEGVEVIHVERPKRKGVIYDYDLVDRWKFIAILFATLIGVVSLRGYRLQLVSPFQPPTSPTYQRG